MRDLNLRDFIFLSKHTKQTRREQVSLHTQTFVKDLHPPNVSRHRVFRNCPNFSTEQTPAPFPRKQISNLRTLRSKQVLRATKGPASLYRLSNRQTGLLVLSTPSLNTLGERETAAPVPSHSPEREREHEHFKDPPTPLRLAACDCSSSRRLRT